MLNRTKGSKAAAAFISLLVLSVILLFISCSTEKNTVLSRSHHNLVSHYNIMFNCHEYYKSALKTISDSWEDDYTTILPVFLYKTEEMGVSSNMEGIIKKSSKLIGLHSIKVKPNRNSLVNSFRKDEFFNRREYNKWVDDAYFITGKAHFYNCDYYLALETFRFMLAEYSKDDLRFEVMLWIARTYNQMKDYKSSENTLQELENNKKFPEDIKNELYLVYADLWLKRGNLENARMNLEKAIPLVKKKKERCRYLYILAQICERHNDTENAVMYYNQIIKKNPSYVMFFNATINKALLYQGSSHKGKSVKTKLLKMAKDEKNYDYLDQIYHAVANIAMKENDKDEAIKYFKQAIENSSSNQNQKALSYLAIADIYYEKSDYRNAQAYYDSAVINLDTHFKRYGEIYRKSRSLTRLVESIDMYTVNDSLLKLSAMSVKERNKIIDDIINQIREEERKKRDLEYQQQQEMNEGRMLTIENRNRQTSQPTTGKWYFYNVPIVASGKNEFKYRWGTRKLEDNWRRSNKAEMAFSSEEISDDKGNAEDEQKPDNSPAFSNTSREYYTQHIPVTDSAKAVAHSKIREGMYNAGIIYKDELGDIEKSTDILKQLITKYENSEYALLAYYELYLTANQSNNKSLADSYKSTIISRFPDSKHAKILSDPDYFKNYVDEHSKAEKHYVATYTSFKANNCNDVINKADYALKNFKNDSLISKFIFLKMLCQGNKAEPLKFREELKQFIATYPKDELSVFANEILDLMSEERPDLVVEEEKQIAEEIYKYDAREIHFVLFVSNKGIQPVNQLNFNIININLEKYEKLNLTNDITDAGEKKAVVIKKFRSVKDASTYLKALESNKELYYDVDPDYFSIYVISESNFNTLAVDKKIERYITFYNNNYK